MGVASLSGSDTRAAVRLRLDEAGPLAQVLVAQVAGRHGLRALAIKGPTVALQGLRAPRTSADVDVLVHPTELEPFIDAMVALGWRRGVTTTAALMMPMHSVNLLHDHWPLGIDVHHYFPGFLADPAQVFDALWQRRASVVLAGVPVPAADPVAQAAIVALHLLRDTPSGRSPALEDLLDRARASFAAGDRADLVALAGRTGATDTLRPFLLGLGLGDSQVGGSSCGGRLGHVDHVDHVDHAEALRRWQQRQRVVGYEAWFAHFAQTPVLRWPQAAWHALMLTDDEIYLCSGVAPGEGNLAALRARRLGRGLAGLPRTLRALARERRG
jgi:hypothetical protein